MANGQWLKAKKKIAKVYLGNLFFLSPLNRCGAGYCIISVANLK